jgi:hypothetical protein
MDPRTVRVFLVDGNPSGILIAEIMNFSGKVIVAPRSRIGELQQRPESKRTGVYFLVGDDPENLDREIVYIGETDNIYARLTSHKNKHFDGEEAGSRKDAGVDEDEGSADFWTRVAFVTSTDDNLTKAHVRHLESILISKVIDANRATIKNVNAPALEKQQLPESDRADMQNFVNQLQLQLTILGFSFLKPKPVQAIKDSATSVSALSLTSTEPTFELSQKDVKAQAREVNEEFVVLKGSSARAEGVQSWTAYKALRQRLVDESKLIPGPDQSMLLYAEDVPFKSPSAAACVTLGRNANGRTEWRDATTHMTYGDWDDARNQSAPLLGDVHAQA